MGRGIADKLNGQMREILDLSELPSFDDAPANVGFLVLVSTPESHSILKNGSFAGSDADLMKKEFFVASLTKTFVAQATFAVLREKGLPRTASVARWIKEESGLFADCTVQDLLDHTSGLSDYVEDESLLQSLVDELSLSKAALLVLSQSSRKARGAYSYSNTGYLALGLTLERLTGEAIEDIVSSRVLKPNNLRGTSFWQPIDAMTRARSMIYDGNWSAISPTRQGVGWSDGAILSNLSDLEAFAKILMAEPLTITMTDRPQYRDGLNWENSKARGPIAWHSGAGPGVRSFMGILPRYSASVIVLANYEAPSFFDPVEAIQNALFEGQ